MHPSFRTLPVISLLAALLSAPAAIAAAPDGNVEWAGISHLSWQDRRPLCPVGGESFQVRFQTWRNDLTAASVHVVAGVSVSDIPASVIGTRGPYDIWAATVPATAENTEFYWIELTDGAMTDYLSVNGMTAGMPGDGGYVLNFTTWSHAPAGATMVSGGAAVFKVWAPTVATAYVRGSFNAWAAAPLARVGEYFIGKLPGVVDRAEYKFWFPTRSADGGYAPDPRARGLNSGGSYNSYVENPFKFTWTDAAFTTPDFDRMVVYQLHVGSFCGLNDPVGSTPNPSRYTDVAARVEHLKSLGVTAVQLNPITEFPAAFSAGYNPITQWSPEWNYGTPDNFKYMVNTLHQNGIAVLLDIVWNHFSPTDNFLWYYDGTQQWFDIPDVGTPWGSQAAFGNGGVADYFANSAHHWLGEYHLDGFRVDGTAFMNPGAHAASGWALMQRLNNEKANRWADKITIAEHLPNSDWINVPTAAGGAGFDTQYHMLFRDNIRGAIFAAASGDPDMNSVRSALLGSGTWISGVRALNYVQLHDEAWSSSGGQRMVRTIDTTAPHDDIYARGRSMLALGLTIVAQGIPAMLMGDEWLESINFDPGGSGRIDWAKKTTYAGVFNFYKRLIRLRTTLDPLRASSGTHVYHLNEAGNVIAFRRTDSSGNPIVVVANFSNTDYGAYRIGLPWSGGWIELVNSQDPQYGGSGPANGGVLPTDATSYDGFTQSLAISLPKMALVVLAPQSYVAVEPLPETGSALSLAPPWPNPSRAGATLRWALPQRGNANLSVFDLTGRMVRTLANGEYAAGEHVARWDGRDDSGQASAPGLYFVRLASSQGVRSTRLVVMP
ncbi:MAG: alpha amylase C-terminal domain-containing protein [Candidatus Eisenbacteria bacterium]